MSKDSIEIERAWILNKMPPKELISHNLPHKIGYLFSDYSGELRIVKRMHRTINGMASNETWHSITVKSGQSGLSRSEWEDDYFPEWAYNILWEKRKASIDKTRHFVPYKKHRLEIDVYNARDYLIHNIDGLHYSADIANNIRMECEFSSEDEAAQFELPEWAQDAREITGITEYRNRVMAEHGWPIKEIKDVKIK